METTTTYIQDELLICVNLRQVQKRQAFSEFLSDEGNAWEFMLSISMSLGLHNAFTAIKYSFFFFFLSS